MILIVRLHFPFRAMQRLPHRLLQVPPSQFVHRHEPIGRVHIDFGEQHEQPLAHIEPLLVVNELFPLGLGLGGGCRFAVGEIRAGLGMLHLLVLLPLLVLAAEDDVGDEGVEGDVVVVLLPVERGIEGEVGAEAEAAVAMGGGALCGGVIDEENDK